jgi:hypothetical protein
MNIIIKSIGTIKNFLFSTILSRFLTVLFPISLGSAIYFDAQTNYTLSPSDRYYVLVPGVDNPKDKNAMLGKLYKRQKGLYENFIPPDWYHKCNHQGSSGYMRDGMFEYRRAWFCDMQVYTTSFDLSLCYFSNLSEKIGEECRHITYWREERRKNIRTNIDKDWSNYHSTIIQRVFTIIGISLFPLFFIFLLVRTTIWILGKN